MSAPQPENLLVFVDIETTGLEPEHDAILEIGVVIADSNFGTVDHNSWVLYYNQPPQKIDLIVWEMHEMSGLWMECKNSPLYDIQEVEEEMLMFLKGNGIEAKTQPMVGNSIHFDRSFLKYHTPRFEGYFHYRNLDISSLNIFVDRYMNEFYTGRPVNNKLHRAIPDCFDSLNTLKYYQEHLRYV